MARLIGCWGMSLCCLNTVVLCAPPLLPANSLVFFSVGRPFERPAARRRRRSAGRRRPSRPDSPTSLPAGGQLIARTHAASDSAAVPDRPEPLPATCNAGVDASWDSLAGAGATGGYLPWGGYGGIRRLRERRLQPGQWQVHAPRAWCCDRLLVRLYQKVFTTCTKYIIYGRVKAAHKF